MTCKNKTCKLKNDFDKVKVQPVFFLKKEIEECKKVSISECINEAILNSIQAKATKIAIMVNTIAKQENLFNNIKSVEIIDDGVGFNKKNKDAFNTLKTENKKDKGCKGYGRMYFKKAFNTVEICSFNRDENNEKVNFVFDDEHFINTDIELHKHSQRERETSLLLLDPVEENIIGGCLYNKNTLYKQIYNVVAPYIFLQANKNVTINFYLNGKQEMVKEKEELKKNEENYPLIINFDSIKGIKNYMITLTKSAFFDSEQKINLWYKITKRDFYKEKTTITTAICHKNRPLFESSFDKQPLQIDININGYDVLFLLEGDWIDKQPIDNNHRIKLDENNKEKWNEIKKKVEDAINEIFCKEVKDLRNYNKEEKKKFIQKYPEYARFACEGKETGYFDRGRVLKQARKYRDELEDKVAYNKGSEKEKEANIREAIYYDLKSYFKHRENILNQFNELKDTKIEGQIHNLLFPQYLSRDEKEKFENNKKSGDKNQMTSRDYNKEFCDKIEFGYNNLWMIDDRFMGYSYIASEQYISTFIKNNNLQKVDGNGEMDIVVYFDNEDKKRVVIVECKKMTAKYKENGTGILQLFKYAKHLYDSGITEIYLVLPVNIDKDFRDILENQQHFCKVFSHKGELWQNSYNDRNAYIQVITPDALIANAQERNKKFIEMANEEFNKQIDEQYKDDE